MLIDLYIKLNFWLLLKSLAAIMPILKGTLRIGEKLAFKL